MVTPAKEPMVIRALRLLTVPILLAGMLVMAVLVAAQVYSGQLFTQLTGAAAVASVLVSIACYRLPAWLVAPLSTMAMAGFLTFAMRYSGEQAQMPADWESVRDGIPRLIAAVVPIEPQPDTLAVPIVATWLAGLAATELASRANRALSGLIPPTLLFGGALWLVGPVGRSLMPALGFAGLALTILAVTGRVRTPDLGIDQATRTALRLRTTLAAAIGLALIAGVASAGGLFVADRVAKTPMDPRSLIEPPDVDALDENPLVRLSGWALEPKQRLLTTDVAEGTRIRLAVLSDYDGVTWRVGATYRPVGRTLPQQPGEDVPQETVRQHVQIDGLTGKLVPAVATPREVEGVRVAYDAHTGTMIRPEGLTEGLSYSVSSRADTLDLSLLPGAEAPSGSDTARYRSLGPGVPADMERLAQTLGSENSAPFQRASAIEQFLAGHYRLDPQAPSGHAYPNLRFFLFEPAYRGGGKGTSEQFAAAFAVLARLLNLPARVVVGFQARSSEITAGDALAWPEVYFTGIGWVPFNPLPEGDQLPKPLEEQYQPKAEPSSEPTPSDAPVPTFASTSDSSPQASASSAAVATTGTPWAAGGGGVLLLIVLFLLAVVFGRARLRRDRLDKGSPSEQVAGAWLEVRDALRLARQPAPQHLSATELATHAGTGLGPLAQVVNEAAFGYTMTTPISAEIARTTALSYIGLLKARQPWWRRLLWTVHPGPLRWKRRSRPH